MSTKFQKEQNSLKMDATGKSKPISVVTVTLNSGKTLDRCIRSVISNKEFVHQHIIVDGGSGDNTLDIVNNYQKEQFRTEGGIEVIVLHQNGKGIYNAMNLGVLQCDSSSFVGILNSDDEYVEESLSIINQHLENDDELIHGICEIIHESGEIEHHGLHHSFLPYKSIYHPTVFISKETYERFGLYDEKISLAADYDYFLRLYRSNVKMKYLPEVISRFYTGGASYKREYLGKWQYVNIRKRLGSISLTEYSWELLKIGFKYLRYLVLPNN